MKHCVITGSGRGIGLETAKALIEDGHKVLAISRNISTLSDIENPNLRPLALDITMDESKALKEEIQSFFENRVDILINNAGLLISKPIEEISINEVKRIYDVNVFGAMRIIQWVLPYMKETSHIVNITSMGGIERTDKFPGLSAYSSSKGALTILTEQLARELQPKNIFVNALALGAVQTEMLEEAFPGYIANMTPEKVGAFIADFSVNGSQFFNGKILPVANTTP